MMPELERIRRRRRDHWKQLFVVATCIAFSAPGLADTLHKIDDGAFQHHGSGWIFPERVDQFSLVGMPVDVNGTIDVVAAYAYTGDNVRTIATVDVYPPDSSADEATFDSAKAAIELKLKAVPAAPPQSTLIEVGSVRKLSGVRVLYGTDATNSRALLYYFDTGHWIIKIRAVIAEGAAPEVLQALDEFVRAQRWETIEEQ